MWPIKKYIVSERRICGLSICPDLPSESRHVPKTSNGNMKLIEAYEAEKDTERHEVCETVIAACIFQCTPGLDCLA